ncbi:MAG: patatin-like phospholipase family protein [Deltaproteobacteria bacterium]|nr:patatin-like phospholipase family protein [Deltaproteobacteria bacterium]
MGRKAIVLSAGGARGAYEAGVVYYIRKNLPPKIARKHFDIKIGTSVGALNTLAMAAMADDPDKQADKIKELWWTIRQEDVYSRDFGATTHFLGSTVGGIIRNLITFNPFQLTRRRGPHFNSFLDTTPLKLFLKKMIPWEQVQKNVETGPLSVVAINATNLRNGRNELFVKRKPSIEYQGQYPHYDVELGVEHAMASAAIPIIFPSIKIDGTYYADGGLRLFTPMSPAIQFGADSMIVVGLRYRSATGTGENPKFKKDMKEPTIALQMGRMLNGVFLDRIEYDMEQLERINSIIDTSEKVYGEDYLTGSDLLSYLTFAPGYLQTLFELGVQDANRHRQDLIDIMDRD